MLSNLHVELTSSASPEAGALLGTIEASGAHVTFRGEPDAASEAAPADLLVVPDPHGGPLTLRRVSDGESMMLPHAAPPGEMVRWIARLAVATKVS